MNRITERIDALLARQDRVVVAIDGSCTAGKTTLAGLLARKYDCCVIHMDDFFLRPEQRTAQRYAEPGGNVDYERFREEVLENLRTGRPFSYRPYDCSTGSLKAPVEVQPKKLTVVEGTYAHHPYFGDAYDLRLYLQVSEQICGFLTMLPGMRLPSPFFPFYHSTPAFTSRGAVGVYTSSFRFRARSLFSPMEKVLKYVCSMGIHSSKNRLCRKTGRFRIRSLRSCSDTCR